MAQKPRRLALRYSHLAERRIIEIWRWNADRYDELHAAKYVSFLEKRARALASEYSRGRPVPNRPTYYYVTVKKRAGGHGYVVVDQIREAEVVIFYYFHTAQDWLAELEAMLFKR
jgi:plasmid stabilization system protein ParE